jgi:hypothetical protein
MTAPTYLAAVFTKSAGVPDSAQKSAPFKVQSHTTRPDMKWNLMEFEWVVYGCERADSA